MSIRGFLGVLILIVRTYDFISDTYPPPSEAMVSGATLFGDVLDGFSDDELPEVGSGPGMFRMNEDKTPPKKRQDGAKVEELNSIVEVM